jgi:hypothetical protein
MFVPIDPTKASFGTFNGHRSQYFEAKTKISHSLTSVFHAGWFHDAASACKDALLKQFESKKGQDRESFSALFESYSDDIWEKAMEDAKISSAFIRAANLYLVHCMGTNWREWTKCGFTSEADHTQAVSDARAEYAVLINREFVEQFKKAIFPHGTDKQGTTYTDSLRPIVLSQVNLNLMSGSKNSSHLWIPVAATHRLLDPADPATSIVDTPSSSNVWKMSALQMWAHIMLRYEGVADIQKMSLAYEVQYLLDVTT